MLVTSSVVGGNRFVPYSVQHKTILIIFLNTKPWFNFINLNGKLTHAALVSATAATGRKLMLVHHSIRPDAASLKVKVQLLRQRLKICILCVSILFHL